MSTRATNAFYFHYDPLGSVRNVKTSSGGTSLTYDYEPFGAVRSQTGTLTNHGCGADRGSDRCRR